MTQLFQFYILIPYKIEKLPINNPKVPINNPKVPIVVNLSNKFDIILYYNTHKLYYKSKSKYMLSPIDSTSTMFDCKFVLLVNSYSIQSTKFRFKYINHNVSNAWLQCYFKVEIGWIEYHHHFKTIIQEVEFVKLIILGYKLYYIIVVTLKYQQ